MKRQRHEDTTARWMLFGHSQSDTDAMSTALGAAGVTALVAAGLMGLSPYAQRFAQSEVERALDGLLEMDAVHAIARAWSKHRQLEAARRRTRTPPGRELVELAAHAVVSDHPFHVDVLVDGVPRQRLDAQLGLRVRFSGLVATVASGRVNSVKGGDAELTVKLAVLGTTVAERRRKLASAVVLASAIERSDDGARIASRT